MNNGHLKELIQSIMEVENEVRTQEALEKVGTALSNIAGQPQNAGHQNHLAESLSEFTEAMEQFQMAFPPREFERVLELSEEAFSPDITAEISSQIAENSLSPNVVYEYVQKLSEERQKVFSNLRGLSNSLDFFKIGFSDVENGMAELGFQIPREFFNNDLEGFIAELSELKRILRFFSEATIGKYEPVKVGEISTSDPLIFLVVAEVIAAKVGQLVQWALTVWIGVETIRNLRVETAKAKVFTEDEVENFFGDKIKTDINRQVESKVAEILDEGKLTQGRRTELQGQLDWALRSLLSKVERGMTVELRIAPPPPIDTAEDDVQREERSSMYEALKRIQTKLEFPEPSGSPVLEIPNDKDDEE